MTVQGQSRTGIMLTLLCAKPTSTRTWLRPLASLAIRQERWKEMDFWQKHSHLIARFFAKKFPGSNIVLIKNEQRLQELGALRSYTRVTNQPMSTGVSRPTQGTGNLPAAEPGGSGPCPQSDSSSQVTSGHAPSGLAAGAESMDVGPQVPENSQNVPTPTPHPGNLNPTDDDIVV